MIPESIAHELPDIHPQINSIDLQRIGACHINMISAIFWQTDPSWDMLNKHVPDDFFFIPTLGNLRVEVNKKHHIIKPGQCIFMPEGTTRTIGYAPGFDYLEVIAIHAHITDALGLPILNQLNDTIYSFNLDQLKDFRSFISIYNQDADAGTQFGKNLLRHLLGTWILEGAALGESADYDPRIREALNIIHQHYSGDLSISGIAKDIGLGVVQFRKLFKRHIQQSPKIYIAHYRLRRAAEALRESQESIRTIAYQVGFQDEHYFHNSFKKFYKCTPAEFRKRIPLEA